MLIFILFTCFVPILASILLITGTIIYAVKSVRENSGSRSCASKKAPLVVLTVGAAFALYILLLVLLVDAAVIFH